MNNLQILETKLKDLSNEISSINQNLTDDEIKPFFINCISDFCDMMKLIAKEKIKNENTSFKGYIESMNFELTRLCEVSGISLEKLRKIISAEISK